METNISILERFGNKIPENFAIAQGDGWEGGGGEDGGEQREMRS